MGCAGRRAAIACGLLLLVQAAVASAQTGLRPADRRPELPPLGEPEQPELTLPPVPPPESGRISEGPSIVVRAFAVEGSTVFSREELEDLTRPYTGRPIATEELHAVRETITRHYIKHGYLTSGAMLPDQDPSGGVVILRVVEGRLSEIEIRGLESFREGYFRARLARAGRAPVSVRSLEAQLQRFQLDPRVARIDAVLAPTAQRGESRLVVAVEEAARWSAAAQFSNDQPVSIGQLAGEIDGSLGNIIGWSDLAAVSLSATEGLREIEGWYELPITPWDTRLGVGYLYSKSDVIEERFESLDIESRSRTARIQLAQPILATPRRRLGLALSGEYRDSESSVVGSTFCFQEDVEDCTPSLAILRLAADGVWRRNEDVVAVRSTLSFGIDVLGATTSSSRDTPDGRFVAWLGQAQWVHLLPPRLLDSQLLVRLDMQLAADPLLSIEQIAVGGFRSVRGYAQNQVVRDNGAIGSIEARVPLWREPLGRPKLELAPFSDAGHAWNTRGGGSSKTLISVGVGLRVSPWPWAQGALYWGQALTDSNDADEGLQRDGIQFELRVEVP